MEGGDGEVEGEGEEVEPREKSMVEEMMKIHRRVRIGGGE